MTEKANTAPACDNCTFYDAISAHRGYCRRCPPQIVGGITERTVAHGAKRSELRTETFFPTVDHFDYCGAFEPVAQPSKQPPPKASASEAKPAPHRAVLTTQQRLDSMIEHGLSVSFSYGYQTSMLREWSVQVFRAQASPLFAHPRLSSSFDEAIHTAHREAIKRGWCPTEDGAS